MVRRRPRLVVCVLLAAVLTSAAAPPPGRRAYRRVRAVSRDRPNRPPGCVRRGPGGVFPAVPGLRADQLGLRGPGRDRDPGRGCGPRTRRGRDRPPAGNVPPRPAPSRPPNSRPSAGRSEPRPTRTRRYGRRPPGWSAIWATAIRISRPRSVTGRCQSKHQQRLSRQPRRGLALMDGDDPCEEVSAACRPVVFEVYPNSPPPARPLGGGCTGGAGRPARRRSRLPGPAPHRPVRPGRRGNGGGDTRRPHPGSPRRSRPACHPRRPQQGGRRHHRIHPARLLQQRRPPARSRSNSNGCWNRTSPLWCWTSGTTPGAIYKRPWTSPALFLEDQAMGRSTDAQRADRQLVGGRRRNRPPIRLSCPWRWP